MYGRALGFDRLWCEKVERPVGDIDVMAGHVGEGAAAEIPPAAPEEGVVGAVIGTVRRGTEPEVPGDVFRNGRRVFGSVAGSVFGTDPDVHFTYRADGAGFNQLDDAAVILTGVDLRAH